MNARVYGAGTVVGAVEGPRAFVSPAFAKRR
jgi:hypothetical protein